MSWVAWLRRVARMGARPDFRVSLFLIGAQKAGTSSLHRYLAAHPQLQEGREKELHFFDRDVIYEKGVGYYHKQFRRRAGAVYFESTPKYIYRPECAERIFRYNRDAKILAVLRDPVERAYSSWNMYRGLYANPDSMVFDLSRKRDNPRVRYAMRFRPGAESYGSFEAVIREELELIRSGECSLDEGPDLIRRGFYAEQLDRYRALFPGESLLLVSFKALCQEPQKVFREVCGFAGIDFDAGTMAQGMGAANVGTYEQALRREDQAVLRDLYAKHDERLQRDYDFDVDW